MQSTLETVLLIFSHLALIPSILYTAILKRYPEFGILLVLFFESTFYHLCQGDWICVVDSEDIHQRADHFIVYSTLFWFVLYFFGIRLDVRILIFFIIEGLLFPLLLFYFHSTKLGIIILIVVLIVVLFLIGVYLTSFPRLYALSLIIFILLLGGGFSFFIIAGEPGESEYSWSHSLWHLFVMLSIFFLLDAKEGKSWISRKFAESIKNQYKKKKKSSSSSSSSITTIQQDNFMTTRDLIEERQQDQYIIIDEKYSDEEQEEDDDDEENSDSSSSSEEQEQKEIKTSKKTKIKSILVNNNNTTITKSNTLKKSKSNNNNNKNTSKIKWTSEITEDMINNFSKSDKQLNHDKFVSSLKKNKK